jgi:hypothetical protein
MDINKIRDAMKVLKENVRNIDNARIVSSLITKMNTLIVI